MMKESARTLAAFKIFLRVDGVLTLIIFSLLLVGMLVETPLLSEYGGALNWTIWNDVRFGNEHNHVPPMLMIIYIVWGVFLTAQPVIHRPTYRFSASQCGRTSLTGCSWLGRPAWTSTGTGASSSPISRSC